MKKKKIRPLKKNRFRFNVKKNLWIQKALASTHTNGVKRLRKVFLFTAIND